MGSINQSPAWILEVTQLYDDSRANSLEQKYFDYFCLLLFYVSLSLVILKVAHCGFCTDWMLTRGF